MNIFVLDRDPVQAALMQCNKHTVKMCTESAQMLCSVYHRYGIANVPYKNAHWNHPCTLWSGDNFGNFMWHCIHASALAGEYTYRYGRRHGSEDIIDWCATNAKLLCGKMPNEPPTPHPQCMPDQYKNSDPVKAYRAFYIGEKARFAVWNHGRQPPSWWPYK